MKILGIDTSTNIFSVCICDDDSIIYEIKRDRAFNPDTGNARFFSAVKELIDNMGKETIDAIALSIGPGMFTSLRVGLALAKGLHISMNIPICGVNTLEAIAESFLSLEIIKSEKNILCVPVMVAFQGEIFVAFFNHKGRIREDHTCNPDGLIEIVKHSIKDRKVFAIGPGAGILKAHKLPKNLVIIDSQLFFPSSSKVVHTALPRIRKGAFDNPELLEPHYIKKTSAELGRKK